MKRVILVITLLLSSVCHAQTDTVFWFAPPPTPDPGRFVFHTYDDHTIDASLDQAERLVGYRPKLLAGDRGYRGQKQSGTTEVVIPDVPRDGDSYYKRRQKHDLFCKQAGIEPVIGHLKAGHRLCQSVRGQHQSDAGSHRIQLQKGDEDSLCPVS